MVQASHLHNGYYCLKVEIKHKNVKRNTGDVQPSTVSILQVAEILLIHYVDSPLRKYILIALSHLALFPKFSALPLMLIMQFPKTPSILYIYCIIYMCSTLQTPTKVRDFKVPALHCSKTKACQVTSSVRVQTAQWHWCGSWGQNITEADTGSKGPPARCCGCRKNNKQMHTKSVIHYGVKYLREKVTNNTPKCGIN